MKKTLLMVLVFVPCLLRVAGQNDGQIIAARSGGFRVSGLNAGGFSFPPATLPGERGRQELAAFSAGAPIKIVDSNPNLTEIAMPPQCMWAPAA